MSNKYEMIIGLTAPIGVDLDAVVSQFTKAFEKFDNNYNYEVIKLANLICPEKWKDSPKRDIIDGRNSKLPLFRQVVENDIKTKDKEANDKISNHDIFAAILALNLQKRRKENNSNKNTIYILDSLKHPEDIKSLKRIYKHSFYSVGVTASLSQRIDSQIKSLDKESSKVLDDVITDQAVREVYEDYFKSEDKLPNQVDKAYELSDLFINLNSNDVDDKKLEMLILRFVDLICGAPIITPTKNEHSMFMAYMYSLRSADLSRQVGSTIVNQLNDVLAMGANEVPQGGGGQYWAEDNYSPHLENLDMENSKDQRDYIKGGDVNAEMKEQFYEEIAKVLTSSFHIEKKPETQGKNDKKNDGDSNNKQELSIQEQVEKILGKTSLRDLTEYGRVVHAEMSALMSAARNGISVKDTDMFCTTYPCHNCAKHIVAAGIKNVQYIEPYPKSKALSSHSDAIYDPDAINLISKGEKTNKDQIISEIATLYKENKLSYKENKLDKRVKFEPFSGVGPQRYTDLFSMSLGHGVKVNRKEKSKAIFLDRNKLTMPRVPVLIGQSELNESYLFKNILNTYGFSMSDISDDKLKTDIVRIITRVITNFKEELTVDEQRLSSTVQYWNKELKYGFVKSLEGVGNNYGFNTTNFDYPNVIPEVGQKVSFILKDGNTKAFADDIEFIQQTRLESTVNKWDLDKGFGYIKNNSGEKDYYFKILNISNCSKGKFDKEISHKDGVKVSFELVNNQVSNIQVI